MSAPPQGTLRFHTACLFAAFLCLLSLIPFPMHSFYRMVQYAVAAVAAYCAIVLYREREFLAIPALAVVFVMFNPVRPVLMSPRAWQVAHAAAALFFVIAAQYVKPGRRSRAISDEDAEAIRAEYLRATEYRELAEQEHLRARSARERAERLRHLAEEEWQRARSQTVGFDAGTDSAYEVLGVHPTDSLEAIRDVYRRLAILYHPDRHTASSDLSRKQKNDLMARINASYEWVLRHHPS